MSASRPSTPLLLHVFPTFSAAGSQTRTIALMNAFGREFRHAVLALDGVTSAGARIAPDIDVRWVAPPPKAGTPMTVLRLERILRRVRPDLVLTYNFGSVDAVLAAKLASLPCIHHEDGFNPDEARTLKARRVWLRWFALAGIHAVVVISEKLERIALERYRLPRDLVRFVPNGIDLERFAVGDRNVSLRRELGVPDEALLVGAVGQLRAEKNLARLLDAVASAARDADVRLLVLGDGAQRAELEAKARSQELAGRVHFAGYHADPRAHYRALDVFAISSDTEQQPLALLEALACGLPAVSTDVGDVRSMVSEPNRAHVHPLDANVTARLAASLVALARDRGVARALGAANRAHVEAHFDARTMRATYRELYCGALGARLPR